MCDASDNVTCEIPKKKKVLNLRGNFPRKFKTLDTRLTERDCSLQVVGF